LSQILIIFATKHNKMISLEDIILTKILGEKDGTLFFTEDFLSIGNAKAVSKALERLEKKEQLRRVARGIYKKPEYNSFIGEITGATVDEIARAIARRDKARIIPTGVYALNALGLSTQVPMNVVYLTDGAARKINVGRGKGIVFKKTSPKNLAAKGMISSLVIQALKVIEKDKIREDEKRKVIDLLKKEDAENLNHDILVAPEWIRVIMREALK
jgi:predicted transcriptional regulator of viral defense system